MKKKSINGRLKEGASHKFKHGLSCFYSGRQIWGAVMEAHRGACRRTLRGCFGASVAVRVGVCFGAPVAARTRGCFGEPVAARVGDIKNFSEKGAKSLAKIGRV